ncbi:prepilin-type N-terminal cleavage/methylation domain-containing protein [Akkermansiaceae bacterium]|nr:prepilin-type N-terminal cleavage/methylation domain-containing protein [Akkermansiaceae bacterium]
MKIYKKPKFHQENPTATADTEARKSKLKRMSAGFSMIEMLVVVGIIALLLGVGINSIKSISQAKGVSVGIPVMKSIVREARQIAITTGVDTHVAFVTKSGASSMADQQERVFRYVIIVNEPKATFSSGEIVSKPVFLPKGCFFDMRKLEGESNSSFRFPGDSSDSECDYWTFNGGTGIPVYTDTANSNAVYQAKVALVNGDLIRSGGEFVVDTNTNTSTGGADVDEQRGNQADFEAFYITRNGELLDLKNKSDAR